MDKVILGDNQFFGINHMSESKAQAQTERFQKLDAIIDVIDIAYDAGIRGFMFNTHDRVSDICDYLRDHPTRYSELGLYPSLPYAHKYANAVNEHGLIGALNSQVLAGQSVTGAASTLVRGGISVVKRDLMDVMRILTDIELKMFRNLNVRAIFLQNIVADLLLGFGNREVFAAFQSHIKNRHGVDAGFNTMNLPAMVEILEQAGIENPLVCSAINQSGYLMSPDVASYEETLAKKKFRPMAMSILASGAIPISQAVQYVVDAGVESIVFGASSRNHIVDTKETIDAAFERRGENPDFRKKRSPEVQTFQAAASSKITVRQIPVHDAEHRDVLQAIGANISGLREPKHICITNTESMYHARRKPAHRAYISAAEFSLCDGVGITIAAKAGGKSIRRFNGPVLVEKAAEFGQDAGWKHYFCGGPPGIAEKMSQNLIDRYPKLDIVGTYSPPFRDLTIEEERSMIDHINASQADILWVGLGLLKQEPWISRYKDRLNVPWLVGVGAAFDYHAGSANWAPRWIQKIGFEWLYRLAYEPRMLKRNAYSFAFMFDAIVYEMTHRTSRGHSSK